MAVKHVLELTFAPSLVNKPEVSNMLRAHDVVASVDRAMISRGEGTMILHLMGEEPVVEAAEAHLREAGVQVEVKARGTMTDPLPQLPRGSHPSVNGAAVSKKLWLTLDVALARRPILWEMSRQFNVEFDIRQCSLGDEVRIIGLQLSGPKNEVQGACDFLKSIGVEVEPVERQTATK